MTDHIDTIKTIRSDLVGLHGIVGDFSKSLTALDALEQAMREPFGYVFKDHTLENFANGMVGELYQDKLPHENTIALFAVPPAQQAQPIKSICTDCRHTDSWGLPDSPHCNRCEGGKMWEPLNTSSVNPNVAQQEPPDDATIAGLESSIGILSTLVDEQRQLLGECEAVFGRDDLGLPFEDGDSALIDRVRAHLAATNSPAQQAQAEAVPIAATCVSVSPEPCKLAGVCLRCTPQQAEAAPPGYVLVPASALRWLFGEEGEFECPPEKYFRGKPPAYWWRSVLREKLAAAPQPKGGG